MCVSSMCFLLEHARATKCLYWLDNFKRFQEYTVIYSILHQIHIKWELRMLLQTPENGAGKSVTFCIHEIEYDADVLTSISVVRGLLSQLRSLASKVRSKIHKNPVNRYQRGLSPPRKTAARLTTSPPSDVFLGPSSTTRNATPPLQWCL